MKVHHEVRLSGEGGQGLVLAGKILAEAAAIYAGLNATQSQSYGPEARGGLSRSEVIISDEEIDYPKVVSCDVLLALTQESYDTYTHDLKPEGLCIHEARIRTRPDAPFRQVGVPILQLTRQQMGREIFANVVSLGILCGLTRLVPVEAMRKAIAARVPAGTEEANLKAFELGLRTAAELESGAASRPS